MRGQILSWLSRLAAKSWQRNCHRAAIATQIGVEFLGAEFEGKKGKAHIFLARNSSLHNPIDTGFDDKSDHVVVSRATADLFTLGMNSACAQFEMQQSMCVSAIVSADIKLQTLEVSNWMADSVQHHSRAQCV
jgi:hypothetical protein